jgi:polypeptide N-acetylgalactosaminyltransferase
VTVKEGKPSTVPIVINNYLGEFDQDAHSKKLVPHFKAKMNKSASNNLEANLGLVRNSEDQKIREDGYSKHAFNVLVSSRLDYHREIPDSRHKM